MTEAYAQMMQGSVERACDFMAKLAGWLEDDDLCGWLDWAAFRGELTDFRRSMSADLKLVPESEYVRLRDRSDDLYIRIGQRLDALHNGGTAADRLMDAVSPPVALPDNWQPPY